MKTIKFHWKKVIERNSGWTSYTVNPNETAYWVDRDAKTGTWQVQDSHGAAWGEFKTAGDAMRAVQEHVDPTRKRTVTRRTAAAIEWPFSDSRYSLMVDKAAEFAEYRSGDMAMTDADVNLVALQAMLLGWLYCQEWWQRYANVYPRENPYLTADDKCLEACSDATRKLAGYP